MAIAEDASQPAPVTSSTNIATTASFTPVGGSLIVAIGVFGCDRGSGNVLVDATIADSLGSSWTLVQDVFSISSNGIVRIWIMDTGGSPSARTVTATSVGSPSNSGGTDLTVRVLTGTNPASTAIGALAGVGDTNTATVNLWPTAVGSLVLGGFSHDSRAMNLSATSNETIWLKTSDAAHAESRATWRATALSTSPGVPVAYGFTNVFNGASNMHNVMEVLPGGTTNAFPDPLVNTAEGGSSGTGASLQTTGGASGYPFDSVVTDQGAFTFDSTHGGAHGLMAYGVTTSAAYGLANVGWSASLNQQSFSTLYARAYLYLESLPSATVPVVTFGTYTQINGQHYSGYVSVRSDGLLALLDSDAREAVLSTTVVPTGQWIRIETKMVGATSFEAKLYALDNVTPIETLTTNFISTWSATINQVYFGVTTSLPGVSYWLDDLAVSRTAYLGPAQFPLGTGTAYDAAVNSTKTLAPSIASAGIGAAYDAGAYVRALRNNFTDNAVPNTLALAVDSNATSMYCPATAVPSGYPTAPFVLRLDYDNARYEAVLVVSGSGVGSDPWIVQRGYQSTAAVAHPQAASIVHRMSAADVLGLFDQIARLGYQVPDGVVAAPVGTLYLRVDGGTGASVYVKESGGATAYGWTALHVPGNPHRYRT